MLANKLPRFIVVANAEEYGGSMGEVKWVSLNKYLHYSGFTKGQFEGWKRRYLKKGVHYIAHAKTTSVNLEEMERRWPAGIRPHGSKIQIRIQGSPGYAETFDGNPFNQRDLAAAVKRREELTIRKQLGLPLRKNEADPLSRHMFSVLAQEYLDLLEGEYSTRETYKRILNRYWMSEFGNWVASEITSIDIKRILKSHDISNKTKRNILIPLRGVFDHADISPNPASIKIKRHQAPKIQRYTPTEREALLSQMDGQPLVYFTILFGCGLRPGEALGLEWLDYNGQCLRIHQTMVMRRLKPTTKTHTERDVYVPEWVRSILDACETRFKNTHIFLNTKGVWFKDTDEFNKAWRQAHENWNRKNRKAQIPYRDPYTCRHSRAAELLSGQANGAQCDDVFEPLFRVD